MEAMNELPVIEVFGPTIQGEGPQSGRRAIFVRLADCNLTCSWCDTKYSWHPNLKSPITFFSSDDLYSHVEEIADCLPAVVVLTGGEPLLQQRRKPFQRFVTLVQKSKILTLSVETNGTIVPSRSLSAATIVCSPKVLPQGDPYKKRIKDELLAHLASLDNVTFKFVCRDVREVGVVKEFVAERSIRPEAVWIMPEGVEANRVVTLASEIVEACLAAGFNLTPRLHIILWNNERRR